MSDGTYELRITDNIADSIPKKIEQTAKHSDRLYRSTEKLQNQLGKSAAHNRFIGNQQKLAREVIRGNTAAQKAIGLYARLRTAQIRAAVAATRMADRYTKSTRSILVGSARIISAISRWMSLLGVGFSLKFIIGFTDSFVNLENKLKNVTTTMANLNKVQNEVFESANRARVPVAELGQTYQRIDRAVQGLGFSQKEALKITETASKALVLSGATTQETGAALLQLSQAFNKGKLDGDEFRTVMELMPTAADAIAKQLGVTRGELLKLAPEGKITAKVMADAFEGVADVVDTKFSKITPTIGQALTVMRNRAMKAFGEFDKAHKITERLSRGLLNLSSNMDKVTTVVTAMGAAGVTYIAGMWVRSLNAATVAQIKLNLATYANPYVLVTAAIVGAAAALYAYSDQITVTQDGYITLRDVMIVGWEMIKEATRQLAIFMGKAWEKIKKGIIVAWDVIAEMTKKVFGFVIDIVKTASNTVITIWKQAALLMGYVFGNLPVAIDAVLTLILQSTEVAVNKMIEMFVSGFNTIVRNASGIPGLSDLLGGELTPTKLDFGDVSFFSGDKGAVDNLLKDVFSQNEDHIAKLGQNLEDSAFLVKSILQDSWAEYKSGAAQIAKQRRLSGDVLDADFNRRRGNGQAAAAAGSKGGSSKDKIRQGQAIGVEANAQTFGKSCGKAMAAEIINSHTGKSLKDTDIKTLFLVEEINSHLKASGSNVRYKDIGNLGDAGIEEYIKKSVEKGFAIGFGANGPEFSPSGLGHAMVMQAFKGDQATFMDPNKGRIRNTTFSNLRNAPSRPDGNFVFAPENIDKLQSRHPKEIKHLQKQYKEDLKKQAAAEKEAAAELRMHNQARVNGAKAMKAALNRLDKLDAKHSEYLGGLASERELLGMASEAAQVHGEWLDYIGTFKDAQYKLSEARFKQIVTENKALERQRDIRESILEASERIGGNKAFNEALKAGKDLKGDERTAFASAMLRDFAGIDTDILNNNLNEAVDIWKTYFERIDALAEHQYITDSQAEDAKDQERKRRMYERLAVTEQLFADLSTLTRTGSEELMAVSKAAAIAQTIFKTYEAAQLAYTQGMATGGPAIATLYAAGAVASGLARVAQIRSQGSGYMEGGYTGNRPRTAVAGYVHGQEFVMNAATTSRIGVGNLQSLQDGASLQSFNPPTQRRSESAPVVLNNTTPQITIVSSREAALDGMRSPDGENIVLEIIEANSSVVTRMLA